MTARMSKAPALVVLMVLVVGLMMLIPAQTARAVSPDEVLADRALEARARGLSKNLRCLVCQNQSIDDSDADLARDLRVLVRERLKAGDSDQQVIDFLTARYGDFVLLKPPVKPATWFLWFGPLVVLGLAIGGIVATAMRRRREIAETAPLNAEERAALERILGDRDKGAPS